MEGRKRKWQSASGFQQVNRFAFLPCSPIDVFISFCAGKFEARDLKWAPDGKGFILFDKDQFCCAFEVEDDV